MTELPSWRVPSRPVEEEPDTIHWSAIICIFLTPKKSAQWQTRIKGKKCSIVIASRRKFRGDQNAQNLGNSDTVDRRRRKLKDEDWMLELEAFRRELVMKNTWYLLVSCHWHCNVWELEEVIGLSNVWVFYSLSPYSENCLSGVTVTYWGLCSCMVDTVSTFESSLQLSVLQFVKRCKWPILVFDLEAWLFIEVVHELKLWKSY